MEVKVITRPPPRRATPRRRHNHNHNHSPLLPSPLLSSQKTQPPPPLLPLPLPLPVEGKVRERERSTVHLRCAKAPPRPGPVQYGIEEAVRGRVSRLPSVDVELPYR